MSAVCANPKVLIVISRAELWKIPYSCKLNPRPPFNFFFFFRDSKPWKLCSFLAASGSHHSPGAEQPRTLTISAPVSWQQTRAADFTHFPVDLVPNLRDDWLSGRMHSSKTGTCTDDARDHSESYLMICMCGLRLFFHYGPIDVSVSPISPNGNRGPIKALDRGLNPAIRLNTAAPKCIYGRKVDRWERNTCSWNHPHDEQNKI